MLPGIREFNTINVRDDIDAVGWEAHLEDDARNGKVLKGQVAKGCPEFIESHPNPLGIVWIRLDPDIKILGESGSTVNRKSITADDEEFSVRGVQRGK